MGSNQNWAGRVYDLCVYYMTGTPEGSTESGFMEKPGIEPATPGLQGIALIHYTTGLFNNRVFFMSQVKPLTHCIEDRSIARHDGIKCTIMINWLTLTKKRSGFERLLTLIIKP